MQAWQGSGRENIRASFAGGQNAGKGFNIGYTVASNSISEGSTIPDVLVGSMFMTNDKIMELFQNGSAFAQRLRAFNDVNNGLGIALGTQVEMMTFAVSGSFKSASMPWQFNGLRESQQFWRTNRVLGKVGGGILKGLKTFGVVGNAASVALKTYEVFNKGYLTGRDIADITVNTAAVVAVFALATNPVGWCIGAFSLAYTIGTVIYDANKN